MSNQPTHETIRKWGFILLQVLIVILSMAVGYFGHQLILQYRGEFGLLREARDIVMENAIFEMPNDQTLEYGMIRGMLYSLDDPYTQFVEPTQHELQTDQLTGRYGGVGVRLEQDQAMNWRVYPLPKSPALEAGIQDGDLLLSVGDQAIHSDLDEATVISIIRGPEGEEITITIEREDEVFSYTIKRQSIPLPSVTWNLIPEIPQIGMIQINRIAETTAEEIQRGIEDLQEQGAQAFILDLRDNGGGLVEAGIEIARLFLSEGEIVHRQFKGQDAVVYKVDQRGPFENISLALLINQNTASSAEIVAGVLQAHQQARLVGTATYGKTSIQYIFELHDGSSVHVTSGRWWIPGQTFPLYPDHPLPDEATEAEILQAAIDLLQAEGY